jgi:hypothetical protein
VLRQSGRPEATRARDKGAAVTGILIGLVLGLFVGAFVGAFWTGGARLWPAAATGFGLGVGLYAAGTVASVVIKILDRQSQTIKSGDAR